MTEKPIISLKEFQEAASQLWKIAREPQNEQKEKAKEEARKMAEGIKLIASGSPERLTSLILYDVFQHDSGNGHSRITIGEDLRRILTREEIVADFKSDEALFELGKILTGKAPSGKVVRYNDNYRKPYYPPEEMKGIPGIWVRRDTLRQDHLCDKPFNRYSFSSKPR